MGLKDYTGGSVDSQVCKDTKSLAVDIPQLVNLKIEEGPKSQRLWFNYSIRGLTGGAVLSGMYFTALLRRSMKVYEAVLPTHVLVGVSTSVIHYIGFLISVQYPAVSGKLCPVCATLRGSAVQVATACVLPSISSALVTSIMADRYKSAQVPEIKFPFPKEFKDFWRTRYQTLWGRAWPMLIFQGLFGGIVGYQQNKIAEGVREKITPEEYETIWSETISCLNSLDDIV